MTSTAEEMVIRVNAAIELVTPPGLGAWPRAWEMVDAPSARFLEMLKTYRRDDELSRKRVEQAGNDVVRAWKRAAAEWQQARGAG